MQSLKNNYEKVILGVLLVGFVGSGIYWLVYLGQIRAVAGGDELVKVTHMDNKLETLTDEDFTAEAKLLKPDVAWGEMDDKPTGDLFRGRDYIRCKNPDCFYWIAYNIQECPHCGVDEGDVAPPPTEDDGDHDDIPDKVEASYDFLNPGNPLDANLDPDRDWFTNIEEYRYFQHLMPPGKQYDGAAMADPKIHPPLATRLRLVNVDRDVFGIMVDSVMAVKGQEKKDWDISLKVREKGRMRSRFVKIGDTVQGYKITDADEKSERVYDKNVNDWVKKDVSTVTLRKDDEEPVVLTRGEKKYVGVVAKMVLEISPTETRRLRPVRAGDQLQLRDSIGQVETYLVQADENSITATLIGGDGQKPQSFLIDRTAKISRPVDTGMPMEMPEPMGMPYPGTIPPGNIR